MIDIYHLLPVDLGCVIVAYTSHLEVLVVVICQEGICRDGLC